MNLSIDNISFRYSRKKPWVLEDFSLNFDTGGVIGLLGPNGVGKSTLLYIISGLLFPATGEASFGGVRTSLRRPDVLSEIFLVPEEIDLPKMTLEAYCKVTAPFYPKFDREVLDMCLSEFEFVPTGSIDALSMGQKKKIFLSIAFAAGTRVLLMDEPTNGLDIPGKAAFRRICARLASDDRIFIISTHQVRDLDKLLDHVVIMSQRKAILNAGIADIQRRLKFVQTREVPTDALYQLPSVGGFDIITPNPDDEETEVNLESLFAFAMGNPDKITELFTQNNSQEND